MIPVRIISFCVLGLVLGGVGGESVGRTIFRTVAPDGTVTYTDVPSGGEAVGQTGGGNSSKAAPGTSSQANASKPAMTAATGSADARSCGTGRGVLWADDFSSGLAGWGPIRSHWGASNLSFRQDAEVQGRFMRVFIPGGTYDPASMKRMNVPQGGSGFKARPFDVSGVDCLYLSYYVRFPEQFQFVRGGKLPGLFGGMGNGGGRIPNGRDGFSTRFMWRENGRGEVYAYLPTSQTYGTSLGRGTFTFVPGRWHKLQQQVVLNAPGRENGLVRVWMDGVLAYESSGVRFRDVDSLKIDGVFFDVFFGGGDPTWAARTDTYVDFANFVLSESSVHAGD